MSLSEVAVHEGARQSERLRTSSTAFYAKGADRWTAYHPCEERSQSSLAYHWGNALAGLRRTEEGLKLVAVSDEVGT